MFEIYCYQNYEVSLRSRDVFLFDGSDIDDLADQYVRPVDLELKLQELECFLKITKQSLHART